jgi:hypothetical protein
MANWTTFADVTTRWVGSGVPTDETLVDALIEDAEAVILSVYPGIQARIDATTLSEAVVTMVTVRMVSRLLRNPEGLTYWQQQTGPFGQGRNFGSNVDIWITEDERTLLAPQVRGKAFSVNLGPNAIDGRYSIVMSPPSTDEPVWIDYESYVYGDGDD